MFKIGDTVRAKDKVRKSLYGKGYCIDQIGTVIDITSVIGGIGIRWESGPVMFGDPAHFQKLTYHESYDNSTKD